MSKSHNRISDGDSSERQVVFWAHSSHFTEPWQSLCTNGLKESLEGNSNDMQSKSHGVFAMREQRDTVELRNPYGLEIQNLTPSDTSEHLITKVRITFIVSLNITYP
ncbi:predicted protein [Histoplasma capsulatum var. duboisii H88]|uniref:Predicted protein n=2 Tax=Ajellomyces capsulatus TaxID=5037 RepID=F0U782_AJEC8|nr:predicted protein [Histoplasma capsulatum H143]EGC41556.1 predicted protein [Histoplasma capsulatum var. duboisii H88]